ncbi:MAG: DUF1353 domain-containing protein [Proteobacteria bacterium]|nr:DUF1353 domain-containing protein [Pseudomonadota bacterium]
MSNHGSFSGIAKTEWLVDDAGKDRDMKLLENFSFVDPDGRVWLAPAGSIINGASIPRPLWVTVGSPYTDDYRRASIVHDVACDTPSIPRKEADVMFYHACIAGGCSKSQAKILYAGVRIGVWSSRAIAPSALDKTRLLFRVPFKRVTDERFIQDKFQDIANALISLPDNAPISDLDAKIEEQLNF